MVMRNPRKYFGTHEFNLRDGRRVELGYFHSDTPGCGHLVFYDVEIDGKLVDKRIMTPYPWNNEACEASVRANYGTVVSDDDTV